MTGLQAQHDKLRRRALLGPTNIEANTAPQAKSPENPQNRLRHGAGAGGGTNIEMIMGGVEAIGVSPGTLLKKRFSEGLLLGWQVQRTPLVARAQNHILAPSATSHNGSGWIKPPKATGTGGQHRQPFAAHGPQVTSMDRSFRSGTVSECSDNEVEQILLGSGLTPRMTSGWGSGASRSRPGEY